MTQTAAQTATINPESNTTTTTVSKTKKPVSVWKYRLIIIFLILIIIALLGGAGYGAWYSWNKFESDKNEISKLSSKVNDLEKERNLSVEDLKKEIEEKNSSLENFENENFKLKEDLKNANQKISDLTPKNIRDYNYKQVLKIDETAGNVWLNPIFVDVTGDGKEDAIVAYRQSGTGGFLNVYVYSYLNTNSAVQILKAEGYQKGTVAYNSEEKVVEIKSEAGTPDAPTVATTKYRFDSNSKSMIKI